MPTAGSTTTFTLQVTDALGSVSPASSAFSLTINSGLTIAGTPPTNGEVGTPYSASFSASGGMGSGYVFSLASGTLPAGLALSTAGSLTGTPTASGTFGFTVAVVDGAGGRGQASHSIAVSDAMTAPTATFAGGMVGVSYTSAAPAAHGGLAPYVWSLASGSLPAGLSLNATTGIVAGVPSTASTSSFTLKVTDALGVVSPPSSAISVTIDQVLTISSGTYVLTVGSAANLTPAIASGGSGTFTNYAAINGTGTLAALGLSFNSTGTITGTPTVTGSWTGSVVVTDSHGHTATSGQITVYVDQPLSVSGTPAAGQVGSPYSYALAVSGGTGTYPSYSVTNTTGTLAALGLSFSAGSVTGTPSASGTWSGTITVTDTHGTSKTSGSLTIKIDPALVISGIPAQGNAGAAYSFTPAASGGSGSYASYAVTTTSGSLASLGLAFTTSTGKISGSTPVAGSWSGTITVTDSDGNSATSSPLTVQIVGPLTISGTPTTGAIVGNAYSWTPAISGGTAPYTVSYTTSSGPTLTSMGLSFSSTTGTISGTPTSGGVWNGTISATDATKTTVVSSALSLSVAGAAPTIVGGPLKTPWAPNVAMPSTTFTATGGVQPYTWSLAVGSTAVPVGVSISSSGVVSGTPTTAGTYNFNVKATNSTGGQSGTMPVTLVVSASSFVATSGGLDGLTINRWPGFNAAPLFTPTAYNATGAVTWTMTGQGASGLSINASTGAVSGTLSSTYGVYPLTVTGTDAASHVSSFIVTLTISHRSGSSGGSDPLNATIYLNGVACGTGTMGAATCSGTLTGMNSTLELVYPVNVQSSQFVVNATSWPSANNLEVSYGDGVSYNTCNTGSVSSGTPTISCPASLSMYATHYRVRVISMTGSLVNPGLKVNAYFDPP
jgi:large repetitive protein